mgnify:FL=1
MDTPLIRFVAALFWILPYVTLKRMETVNRLSRTDARNFLMAKLFTKSSSKRDAPLADPTELAKFGNLEVVARLVVEGYMLGQHKSPFKGASIEFVEHRQYYPGDEIRHIDWRAYGKTGKYYIKEYED